MATSSIIKEFLTETKSSSSVSVSSKAFERLAINVSKSGYTPIGVLALSKNGASSGYCVISNFFIDGSKTTLNVDVVNTFTDTATVNIVATILYQKS